LLFGTEAQCSLILQVTIYWRTACQTSNHEKAPFV
jgi:hypothetical protein